MKIIHFSDTHLWYWDKSDRGEDFYKNFDLIIWEILDSEADYVIHSWDLFHNSKPSNKAISKAIGWFMKLSKAGKKVILIAWNHDTPRLSTTTHSFEIFKEIPDLYINYLDDISKFSFSDINFVCLPHIHDEDRFKSLLSTSEDFLDKDKKNIFVSHFWLSSKEYDEYTDEISWVNILISDLDKLKKYDYVALWHYHKNFCIAKICYSWSIEHTSFNQKAYNIGYNFIDLSWDKAKIKAQFISSRAMIDLWFIDCKDFKNTSELLDHLENNIDKEKIKWAITKIIFDNINIDLLLEFRDMEISDFFKETFSFEYRKNRYISDFDLKQKRKLDTNDENFVSNALSSFLNDYNFDNISSDKSSREIDKTKFKEEILELFKADLDLEKKS